jgi:hypothetical protein
MDSLVVIEPGGYRFFFYFLSSIGIVLGLIVYVGLRYPASRRNQFRHRGSCSVPVSLGLALVVSAPIVSYAYAASWSHFYTAELDGSVLRLRYEFPSRFVEVPMSDIVEISSQAHTRKSGTMFRLMVEDLNGTSYTSQLMPRHRAEPGLNALRRSARSAAP